MVYEIVSVADHDDPTLEQLLSDMASYGFRYRIWKGKRAYEAAALLESLHAQQRPPLSRRCDLLHWEEKIIAGKNVAGWELSFVTETQRARTYHPSPYFIEDLLNSYCLDAWLARQEPDRVIAVLAPEAKFSTFLDIYFQDQLGAAPDERTRRALPPWYDCLEGLISSLDPSKPRREIQIRAATMSEWIAIIHYTFDLEDLQEDV